MSATVEKSEAKLPSATKPMVSTEWEKDCSLLLKTLRIYSANTGEEVSISPQIEQALKACKIFSEGQMLSQIQYSEPLI